ncbi:hypothetical protein C1D09_030800 [Mesorhizobium intechi]|uniref:Uncharacterized protein n=1 Tax=Mesorhizobium intechi TaxID=537601 RepID=A0A8T9AH82_9HYPH|nr:hypothetical protein C1D09_030800 [Mesorhizobium intechi]
MSRSTASTARTLPKWRETFWKETADVIGCPDLSGSSNSGGGAAPHPPAGTFSPYSDGEKGLAETPAPPLSPFFTGRG